MIKKMDINKKLSGEVYDMNFFGLRRSFPLSYLSPKLQIANFNLLGDIDFVEKAAELLKMKLDERKIKPDYFVGPDVKVVPLVHTMAMLFGQKTYIILRKSVKGYMSSPIIEYPGKFAPHHTKKLVLSGTDAVLLKGKKVVLIDDIISTGATMRMLNNVMKKISATVLCECSIFKQGSRYQHDFIYLADLPILIK